MQEKAVADNSGKIRWTILRRMLNAKLPLLPTERLTVYYSPHYVLQVGPAAVWTYRRRKHGLYAARK